MRTAWRLAHPVFPDTEICDVLTGFTGDVVARSLCYNDTPMVGVDASPPDHVYLMVRDATVCNDLRSWW